jgi:enediyne biosynthesis protein E4
LILAGLGNGAFRALSVREAGIFLPGEQRACAVADYDGDGRPDVAISQNNGPTKLFHNEIAPPGIRIRLTRKVVPAYGAVLGPADHSGPVQTITAGTGFYSQDSAVLVVAAKTPAVRVHWPGGKITTNDLPATSRSFRIDADGSSAPE